MHPPSPRKPDGDATWRTRLASLRNIRPLLGMVWDTSPALVSITTALRLVRALLPLAMLWVSKLILDGVVAWKIRPLLGMVWDTSPALVSITTALRLVRALLPLAMLWVSKLILDGVVAW